MSQVNFQSIDVAQPSDNKNDNSFLSNKESDVSTFASLVEEHIEKVSEPSRKPEKLNPGNINGGNISSGSLQEIKEKQIQENKLSLSNEALEDKVFDEKHERNETTPIDEVFLQTATDKIETDEYSAPASKSAIVTDDAKQAESQKLLNFLAASDEVLAESGTKDKTLKGKGEILPNNTASKVTMGAEQSKSGSLAESHSTVADDNLTVTKRNLKGAEQLNSDEFKGISQRDLTQQQSTSDKDVTQASKEEGNRNESSPKAAFDKAIEISNGTQNNSSLKSLIKEAQRANGQKLTEGNANQINANAENIIEEHAVAEALDVDTQTETRLKAMKVNSVTTDIKSDKPASTSSQNTLINSTMNTLKSAENQSDETLVNVSETGVDTDENIPLNTNKAASSNMAAASTVNPIKDILGTKSSDITKNDANSAINNELEVGQQNNEKESVESKVTEEQKAINNGLFKTVDKSNTAEISHNVNSGGNSTRNDMGSQAMDDSSYSQQIEQLVSKTIKDNQQIQKTLIATDTIAIYKKEFAAEMKDKVMVMINQKLQQVDIQLDPPELGNVHVRVNLQNEQAAVSFVVQNQQAKEALEQHMGKLRDMLGESGVDVGDSNVAQQDQSSDSDNQEGQLGQGSQNSLHDDVDVTTLSAEMVKGSAVGVDFYA